ncbi:MAG: hypothetical protein Ct9H300mP13_0710 [Gammaproteobacteria bacterium]|nr:MAG: hypothetical protein Ct9H300mP13_0710 [Gammaproteobacteria bacterium]
MPRGAEGISVRFETPPTTYFLCHLPFTLENMHSYRRLIVICGFKNTWLALVGEKGVFLSINLVNTPPRGLNTQDSGVTPRKRTSF